MTLRVCSSEFPEIVSSCIRLVGVRVRVRVSSCMRLVRSKGA